MNCFDFPPKKPCLGLSGLLNDRDTDSESFKRRSISELSSYVSAMRVIFIAEVSASLFEELGLNYLPTKGENLNYNKCSKIRLKNIGNSIHSVYTCIIANMFKFACTN